MSIQSLSQLFLALERNWPTVSETVARGNINMLRSFLGPAFKGLVLQTSRGASSTLMTASHDVHYDWQYLREFPAMARLYEAAKSGQWNVNDESLDWSREFDPLDQVNHLIPDSYCPGVVLPIWGKMSEKEKAEHRQALLSWMLSQILHGEQGALYGAAQVLQAVPWLDGKLFGATQVVDEARHVEVFHRYLNEKLHRKYEINENLYVLSEALVADPRWDIKFLGMQIMIEGFALGAFTMIRGIVNEPLLREILRLIVIDEARHVNYGVLALKRFYETELNEKERAEREDLAFEIALLLQRRFLIHEMYEEYWGNYFTLKEWNKFASDSQLMTFFRNSMFRLMIPNLKRLGLLTERSRPRYAEMGILSFESGRAMPDLTSEDILAATP
ncbi:MAG: ferritin-like domain-containing protein [Cyanobacteria bacterium SZAS LIN-3]|nr:ferritin-like domain-containing protein [Cyanobacteria bacterium SZAS LIN-3]